MGIEERYSLQEIEEQILKFEGIRVEIFLLREHIFTKRYDEFFEYPLLPERLADDLPDRINIFVANASVTIDRNVISIEAMRAVKQVREVKDLNDAAHTLCLRD